MMHGYPKKSNRESLGSRGSAKVFNRKAYGLFTNFDLSELNQIHLRISNNNKYFWYNEIALDGQTLFVSFLIHQNFIIGNYLNWFALPVLFNFDERLRRRLSIWIRKIFKN
jgi:hypothetical protein